MILKYSIILSVIVVCSLNSLIALIVLNAPAGYNIFSKLSFFFLWFLSVLFFSTGRTRFVRCVCRSEFVFAAISRSLRPASALFFQHLLFACELFVIFSVVRCAAWSNPWKSLISRRSRLPLAAIRHSDIALHSEKLKESNRWKYLIEQVDFFVTGRWHAFANAFSFSDTAPFWL